MQHRWRLFYSHRFTAIPRQMLSQTYPEIITYRQLFYKQYATTPLEILVFYFFQLPQP